MEKRFNEIINKVAKTEERKLNNMLDPVFLEANREEKTSEIIFFMREWEKNQRGEIHGGSIAAMFDTAMGITAAAFQGTGSVTTADLQISYIRPLISREYIFTSEVTSLGKTLIRVRCKAREKDKEKIVATATGTYVPYNSK
ncbi:MAG: PaaI family thioesterase [Anaerovoracaceae bacterium]